MRRLPIARQVFWDIREENLLYVDKTARILEMLRAPDRVFFLARPRRFGKTLLCTTLHAIFDARRELFDGLAIGAADSGWEWKKYPVIRLDMSAGGFSDGAAACALSLQDRLVSAARRLDVPLRGETLATRFAALIEDVRAKYGEKAAVIIDEYDSPLLSMIGKPQEFNAMREILRDFYRTVKVKEEDLRFTFITGITKFSKVSIFSALNNLTDITLDPKYADICGIMQEEMERDFVEYIDKHAAKFGGRDAYLARLRNFYNGYRFTEKPLTVYNPYGLLLHFNNGEFHSYWFESGTPNYLVELLKKANLPIIEFSNVQITVEDLRKFDLENLEPTSVLFQSGYLTIKDYNADFERFTLDYPNTEVRGAFANELATSYLQIPLFKKSSVLNKVPELLYNGEIDRALEEGIKPFLAGIPYDISSKEEKYFQSVFHIIFNMLGLRCRSEVRTASGRADSIVETPKYVYCFEFKTNGTADVALAQIDTKEYLTAWTGTGKTLVKVGVVFDGEKRQICEWKVGR
ncbi:MAG: ATP-binding protein [Puniceicoccales bacterium]|nr:ATP-binding protein [Puniceicoccales bacterium]